MRVYYTYIFLNAYIVECIVLKGEGMWAQSDLEDHSAKDTWRSGSHILPQNPPSFFAEQKPNQSMPGIRKTSKALRCTSRVHPTTMCYSECRLHYCNSKKKRTRYFTALKKTSEVLGFACRLGCRWDYHRAWTGCSHIAFVDFSFVDLVLFFRCF
jgi:hypothetical protein